MQSEPLHRSPVPVEAAPRSRDIASVEVADRFDTRGVEVLDRVAKSRPCRDRLGEQPPRELYFILRKLSERGPGAGDDFGIPIASLARLTQPLGRARTEDRHVAGSFGRFQYDGAGHIALPVDSSTVDAEIVLPGLGEVLGTLPASAGRDFYEAIEGGDHSPEVGIPRLLRHPTRVIEQT